MSGAPYYSFSRYLKEKYGKTAYRVGVDAGFTCPHRSESGGGCSFCDAAGARSPYLNTAQTIREQIDRATGFLVNRYGAEVFLLYFQAYTNTHAPVEQLRRLYDTALSAGNFSGLYVSTRPDCAGDEVLDLLSEYRNRGLDVWIELGLQSVHEKTLTRINRGHTAAAYFDAVRRIRAHGLKYAVHLMAGLPGEGMDEFLASVAAVSTGVPDGIKFHNTYLVPGSPLFEEALQGEIAVLSRLRYIDYLLAALEIIPPETIVMRLSTDPVKPFHGLPSHIMGKNEFIREVEARMRNNGLFQGRLYPGRNAAV